MATTRIKDLSKTATTVNSDANLVLDGNTGGTQKISRDNFRQDTADAFVAAPGTYNLAPLNSGTGKIDAVYLSSSSDTPKGAWDASSNTPTLADGSGTAGDYYDVTVAGSSDLGSGSIAFTVGDVVKYNGTVWFKIDSVANILDGVSTIDGAKTAIEIPDVGTGPSQVPLNQHLGTMAYQSSDGVSMGTAEVETLEVTGQVSGNLTVSGDVITSTRLAADTINSYTGASVPLTIQTGGAQNLILGTNATERVRIDSSGNTGFGQPNPSSRVDINGVLTVDSDYPPTSAVGGLNLGDYQSGGYKWIQSLNSQPLVLNPTGNNVGIGGSPSTNLHIHSGSRVDTRIERNSTSAGEIGKLEFAAKDSASNVTSYALMLANSTVTTNGSEEGKLSVQVAGGSGYGITAAEFTKTGIVMGSGKGIDFGTTTTGSGVTVSDGILGDYESGTWEPTYAPSSGSFTTVTMTRNTAKYVKVGKQVTVFGYILTSDLNTTGGSGNVQISGLPFISSNPGFSSVSVGYTSNWGTNHPAGGYVASNASVIYLTERKTDIHGPLTEMAVSNLNSVTGANYNALMFSATYLTTS